MRAWGIAYSDMVDSPSRLSLHASAQLDIVVHVASGVDLLRRALLLVPLVQDLLAS